MKSTYPLAVIISEKSFENVRNLHRISLISRAIEINARNDREV